MWKDNRVNSEWKVPQYPPRGCVCGHDVEQHDIRALSIEKYWDEGSRCDGVECGCKGYAMKDRPLLGSGA